MVTCGSGYSIALACRRLGEAWVTSVDVAPYLIRAARDRLTTAGHRPQLEVCDVTGELPSVYDRIVSTVSVPAVPASWLTALPPAAGW
ncbi:methyltransferase domain-containing protein [Streptomyces goshikiensis]|uniref:methyltransferase domain-containing protein n=1 Tax=Streptomyces goshikiensis TaxID=1942 RepID=UPI00369BB9A3